MLNKPPNKTDFIGSLAKGLKVIEAFTAQTPRLSITDVAQATGFDRATSRRCLLTLHELGYADYDGKFFQLTPRVLRLGMGALAALPLPQIVQPWLDQLSDNVGQSSSVSILDETEIVYIARAAQKRVMSIGLLPGSRLPAHCTSMGRVLLAALPDAEVRVILECSDLTPRTARSLTESAEIMGAIAQVRKDGYALIREEVEMGLQSIAVPVLNAHGQTVAALNIGMSTASAKPLTDLLPELKRVQNGLQRVLR